MQVVEHFFKSVASKANITITGTQILSVAGLFGLTYISVKQTRKSQKETSSDKPSWVTENMVEKSKSAQQNATDILNNRYGFGNWPKGPKTEFNRIVKWIERYVRYYRGKD